MYSKTSEISSRPVGHERRCTSSFLSVAKKLSATALSKQSPLEPIETAMPASRAFCPNARLTKLRALVAMMDEPGRGPAAVQRHLERVDDELVAHVAGHAPAGDPARVGVLEGGEVDPALPGPQVG